MTWWTWQRQGRWSAAPQKQNSSYLGTHERDVSTTAAIRGLRGDAFPSLCFCFRVLLPEKSVNMCICRTLRRARWSEIRGRKFPQRHQSVTGRSAGGGLVKVTHKQRWSHRLYTGNWHMCVMLHSLPNQIFTFHQDLQLLFPFSRVSQVSTTTSWTIDFIFIHCFLLSTSVCIFF